MTIDAYIVKFTFRIETLNETKAIEAAIKLEDTIFRNEAFNHIAENVSVKYQGDPTLYKFETINLSRDDLNKAGVKTENLLKMSN